MPACCDQHLTDDCDIGLLMPHSISGCPADSRTERLVNPHAWETGLVYLQCEACKVWHQLKDNQKMIEEVHFKDPV